MTDEKYIPEGLCQLCKKATTCHHIENVGSPLRIDTCVNFDPLPLFDNPKMDKVFAQIRKIDKKLGIEPVVKPWGAIAKQLRELDRKDADKDRPNHHDLAGTGTPLPMFGLDLASVRDSTVDWRPSKEQLAALREAFDAAVEVEMMLDPLTYLSSFNANKLVKRKGEKKMQIVETSLHFAKLCTHEGIDPTVIEKPTEFPCIMKILTLRGVNGKMLRQTVVFFYPDKVQEIAKDATDEEPKCE